VVTVAVLGIDRCEEFAEQSIISISALVINRVTRRCPRQRSVTELPVKTLKEIEYWSEMEGTERSIFLMGLIEEGLHEWKTHKALSRYKDHRVTLWRAAEIAGVSLSELLAELPKQKIIFQYDMAELNEDLEFSCG